MSDAMWKIKAHGPYASKTPRALDGVDVKIMIYFVGEFRTGAGQTLFKNKGRPLYVRDEGNIFSVNITSCSTVDGGRV